MDDEVCTVLLPDFVDIDVGPRCGKPAVKRLPVLDFPVCVEHAKMFSPMRCCESEGEPRRNFCLACVEDRPEDCDVYRSG